MDGQAKIVPASSCCSTMNNMRSGGSNIRENQTRNYESYQQ